MENALAKKLRLGSCKRALIMNAPEGYLDMLNPLPEDVLVTDQIESTEAYDFVQVFVHTLAEVQQLAPKAIAAVTPEGMLWINYPKGTSKLKTDINRDSGWQTVIDLQFEGVSLVSIDETWSAMRFRPIGLVKTPRSERLANRANTSANAESAAGEKVVIVPDDLAVAFRANPKAADFFATLSYSNRKEYVQWITEAKREETRSARVVKTVEKLLQGIKNPRFKE
ncbi:YdeI/OmpD-associated family protein [Paenibacillus alginolyticus]|uniref:YdeI/OmpD-associated family protein n=1 Tax=Paenibacillus alginolyticus TaxID=59839 RepID=A0ABT4GEB9_9BACL|nr:YdeI/OmpD-associated family protein [Paenibacillus alginolyticus]MCY9694519.1 YdeI/OmpD-associated family protein [Paenibacillus alginolyticus]MEC0142680.1 YdeI/OmpD-associated family protein [Paenibacillus alginolyticus]